MPRPALASAWLFGVGGWLVAAVPAWAADAPAPCPTPCLARPRPAPTPAPEAAPAPAPRPVARGWPAPVSATAGVAEAAEPPPRPPASRRCIDINMRAAVGEPLSAQDMAYLRSEC